jgi:DNA-binding transcriptional regulator YiaG
MTAKSWETGRRSPCGAALRLLEIAASNPNVLAPSH